MKAFILCITIAAIVGGGAIICDRIKNAPEKIVVSNFDISKYEKLDWNNMPVTWIFSAQDETAYRVYYVDHELEESESEELEFGDSSVEKYLDEGIVTHEDLVDESE